MSDGYSTLPSGRGSPRPGSPLTPRTLNSRIAWWLGLCSLLFSTLALLNSSVFVHLPGGHPSSTVRVITLRMGPSGIEQQPMLISEDQLTTEELAMLRNDQSIAEFNAREAHSQGAQERAKVISELIAQAQASGATSADSLPPELLAQIRRDYAHVSTTEEDEVRTTQANEAGGSPLQPTDPDAEWNADEDAIDEVIEALPDASLESYYQDEDGTEDEGEFVVDDTVPEALEAARAANEHHEIIQPSA